MATPARYPVLAAGLDATASALQRDGYLQTVGGVKRFRSVDGALRQWEIRAARNFPVQGAGAVIFKLLLPRVMDFLDRVGGRLLVAPFDSVVFQYQPEQRRQTLDGVKAIMEGAFVEVFPALRPRVRVRDPGLPCWTDDSGNPQSIELYAEVKVDATKTTATVPPAPVARMVHNGPPEGEYLLGICRAEDKVGREKHTPYLHVTFRILSGPHQGSTAAESYFYGCKAGQARLANLLAATDVATIRLHDTKHWLPAQQLVGRVIIGTVKRRQAGGKTWSEVKNERLPDPAVVRDAGDWLYGLGLEEIT